MTYDFKNYKKDTLMRPRDEAWKNWAKFEKIGDMVQGFVADAFYKKGTADFAEARGITVRKESGELVNVQVKYLSFILASTDNLRVGDPITIEFTEVMQPSGKGKQGAKVYKYFGANLPENATNKTIKELTDEDKGKGGTVPAVEEDTVDTVDSVAKDMEKAF